MWGLKWPWFPWGKHARKHTQYLYGVIEYQGIKLGQVLDVVALYDIAVFDHQSFELHHVEQQLCHLAERGQT